MHRVIPLLLCVAGCITRPGMNSDCQWPPEQARPLDLRNGSDRRHLIEDVELAEELAVRYNDRWQKGIQPCQAKLQDLSVRRQAQPSTRIASG